MRFLSLSKSRITTLSFWSSDTTSLGWFTRPRKVGDVDKAVDTAEVDEHAVGGDVLDSAFEYLAFFELGDDFAFLLLEFGFDECFVGYNHVAEFFVDFNHAEFHCLADEYVVVADRLNVDLRAGEEGFDAEYIYNHTALGAAFDEALDDFVVFEGRR